jgi:hypothetical protein
MGYPVETLAGARFVIGLIRIYVEMNRHGLFNDQNHYHHLTLFVSEQMCGSHPVVKLVASRRGRIL